MPNGTYIYTNNKTLQANLNVMLGLLTEDIIYYNKMAIQSFMGSMGKNQEERYLGRGAADHSSLF